MGLEPINIVCPHCGNASYMRQLVGKNVGRLDIKCINCNSYFAFDELYKQVISDVIKQKRTNADRIRAMTDEELARWLSDMHDSVTCPNYGDYDCSPSCTVCWLDWLQTGRGEEDDNT